MNEPRTITRLDEHRDALLAIKRTPSTLRPTGGEGRDEGPGEVAPTRLPERPGYAGANEFLLKARREMEK